MRLFDIDDADSWMRVEEFQDGDTLVLRAELPDVNVEKDVEVKVDDGFVHIQGHREEKSEHKGKESYRSEFRYGEFHRDIPLPKGASEDDVKASYSDGILEVRVPCPPDQAETATRVPITKT